MQGYAYVKVLAEAVGKVGADPKEIAAYVHADTFNIPGYGFPFKWTAWGEMVGPTTVVHRPDQGRTARRRAEHRVDKPSGRGSCPSRGR